MSEPIHKRVRITATVTATAFVVEYDNGEVEIDELDEVDEILGFCVTTDLDYQGGKQAKISCSL